MTRMIFLNKVDALCRPGQEVDDVPPRRNARRRRRFERCGPVQNGPNVVGRELVGKLRFDSQRTGRHSSRTARPTRRVPSGNQRQTLAETACHVASSTDLLSLALLAQGSVRRR